MSSIQLKKDMLLEGSNRYSKIRHQARTIAFNHYEIKKCFNCGYDKHVEVCHIKAIKDFSMDSPLSEINNINNLELLCPNCHWEKENLHKKRIFYCRDCNCIIKKKSMRCKNCNKKKKQQPKVQRPSKEELEFLTKNFTFIAIGKKYNVSDKAVRKWCDFYQINLGNRLGYWAKRRCQEKNGGPSQHPS